MEGNQGQNHVKRSAGRFATRAIVIMICAMFVATLVGRVSWTSLTSHMTVALGDGEVALCMREWAHGSPVPRGGWTFEWGRFKPRFRWTLIGYPGERWVVVPIIAPLSLAGIAQVIVALRRTKAKRQTNICVGCGYDLRQLGSNRCPECGRECSRYVGSGGMDVQEAGPQR